MTILKTPNKARVKLSSLKADLKKEQEGDWIPAVDLDPAIRWHVRSTNYPPFKIARDAAIEKMVRKYPDERVPDEVNAEINGTLAVEHLLLGWDGLDEEYTPEFADQVLTDEAYRAVRNSVFLAASKVGKFEVKFVEEAAKN